MLTIADVRTVAAQRGGRCLSDAYRKATLDLRWRCDAGHEFEKTPARVRRGKWCPECARPKAKGARRIRPAAGKPEPVQVLGAGL